MVSIYADDVRIFIAPKQEDIDVICRILGAFGHFSGMRTNLTKSKAFPIRFSEDQVATALIIFLAKRGTFPCTYPKL